MLTTLHRFDYTDGAYPNALVQGTDGNFYGTTNQGGAGRGRGTVFKITPRGMLTTLYNFCSQGGSYCTDGAYPNAGLVQAANGNFYGATAYGGATGGTCYEGCGTVFKITPGGALTTLHSFDGMDGAYPYAGLIQATDGNFYGTTFYGGANNSCVNGYGCGTVFSITPSGTLKTLYDFCGQSRCADGDEPAAGLVQGTNGNFYGTTSQAEANGNADGTVFSLSVGLGPFVETQPTSGEVGKAIKILGTNLTGATSVTFNGTAAAFMVKSKSEIIATVPLGATTGKVRVTFPRGTRSSNVPFRVK
jgi:uncharacterized repeat protein (TIGR03803 family)